MASTTSSGSSDDVDRSSKMMSVSSGEVESVSSASRADAQPPHSSKFIRLFTSQTIKLHRAVYNSFWRIGVRTFDRPLRVISLTLLLAVVLLVGLLLTIRVETKGDVIWVPQDSESIQVRDRLSELFAERSTALIVLARARDGGNVVRESSLLELLQLHRRVTELSTKAADDERLLTYNNSCAIDPGATRCSFANPLLWWGMNATRVREDASLQATVDTKAFVPSSDGLSLVSRDRIFSRGPGSTRSVLSFWSMNDKNSQDRLDFEKAFLNMMESIVKRSDDKHFEHPDGFLRDTKIFYFAQRSVDDDLAAVVGADLPLFGGAIVLMFLYSAFSLSRWNMRETKFTVALAGTLSVLLAIGSAFGFASTLGIMFTSLTGILPFVLVGIGVDDMFVMIEAIYYRRVWPTREQLALLERDERNRILRELFAKGMAEAGAAITVTSLTNATAFFLGATTSIPATRAFALFAGFGVLFDFFFQLTFFAAVVVLDVRRMADNRVDWFPCKRIELVESADQDHTTQEAKKAIMRRVMSSYTTFLMQTRVRVAVLAGFIILTALGGIGASQLETGLPLTDLSPDGSYALQFQEANLEDFDGFPTRLDVLFDDEGFDYSPLETQKGIEDLTVELENIKRAFGDKRATWSWLRAFPSFVNATAPGDVISAERCPMPGCIRSNVFYSHLKVFLADPRNIAFREGAIVVQSDPSSPFTRDSLVASRFLISMKSAGDEHGRVENMVEVKKVQDQYRDKKGWPVFCHSQIFVYVESDLIQVRETLVTLALAVVAVMIVATSLLIHPLLGVFVALAIIMIDVQLFGWMFVTGVRFNSVAVTHLTMAVGLSFDFVGHIAHGYIDNEHMDRKEKVRHSLLRMGVPVMHGGVTTFLGVMFLAGASSLVFRTFFIMFVGIVILSLIQAFAFLPVLLSFAGPRLVLHDTS